MVKIRKGEIYNIVDEEQFERVYKPNGWELAEVKEESKQDIPLELLHSETEVQNYIKMRSKTAKKFNDGLLKSEAEK